MHLAESLESRRLLTVDFSPTLNGLRRIAGPGVPIENSIYVFNYGTTASPGVAYRVVLANDGELTQDVTVVKTGTLGAIQPEANAVIDIDYDVPSSLYGTNRVLGVIIDPDNLVAEIGEDNNQDIDDFRIATPFTGSTINGTGGDDDIVLSLVGGGDTTHFTVTGTSGAGESGLQIGEIATLGSRVTVNLLAGNDRFTGELNGVDTDVFGGDGNDVISANTGDNRVEGGSGDDSLAANAGDDTILGGDGDDRIADAGGLNQIDAGDGDDEISGGLGNDSIDAGAGDDYVRARVGDDTVFGGAGRDTIHGDLGDDRLSGNAGGDYLNGGDGDDTLLGQGGRDKLHGAAGNDRLIGGAGNDIFDARENGVPGGIDTLGGNAGDDEAYADVSDLLASIEVRST